MNIVDYKKIVSKNKKCKNKILSSLFAFLGGGTLGIISQALSALFQRKFICFCYINCRIFSVLINHIVFL